MSSVASSVVPRWEWRSFGEHLISIEPAFAALPVEQVVDSDEVYLLSTAGADLVKVREGLLDVKHLERVGEDGLEQWVPVLKAPFPLSADDVARVGRAWGVEVTVPAPVSLEDLLARVVVPDPRLHAVAVHKHRVRHRVGGCLAEVTAVRTERARAHTIAVESEDPALVLAALTEVGLAGLPNVDYGRGLALLEGLGPERFAVIDVGTNSVKLHVGERTGTGGWRRIEDRSEVTRLGDGLRQTGRLGAVPMERTTSAIEQMVQAARRHRVAAIAAVGTAGLRVAENASDLVGAVRARSGVLVEVISGEEEARLAYLAATAGLPVSGTRVVFDTGGGSTQLTFGRDGRVDERFSVDVGAVRFTERFGLETAVSREVLAEALAAIAADLGRLDGRQPPDALVGMGGAVTNLAAIELGLSVYEPDAVHGVVLDRAGIDRRIELLRRRTAAERRAIVGLQPARAEVILAGACIVRTVLDKLGKDAFTVSDRGLRHGVLAERFAAPAITRERELA